MLQQRLEHALIHRCLSFATAFGLVLFGAGLAPDEVEAIETADDHYVLGGATSVPVPVEPIDPETVIPLYSESELNDLVGPIALYPDDLIAIVLPASTFPLQVVEAQRFLERSEQDGSTTPDPNWDQSVVALLNYPDVIRLMNEDLDWMSRLGDAVVSQQTDVLAAISQFREHAYAAGNLRSDERQVVSRPEEVIEIAPADPEVIYVPYYEPARVVVYQPAPVFYYYPRPCPVYYYSYPPDYWYRPYYPFWPRHFWGVSLVFNIGWHEHHLHVHDHGHWRRPYFGHHHYAWDRHHNRGDRRWHHDDDRHDGRYADDRHERRHDRDDWHDHEGDRDRGHWTDSKFASASRKGQGKSSVAKPDIKLASADTGKDRTRPAKPVGGAKAVGQPTSGKPAASANPTKLAAAKPAYPTKPGVPASRSAEQTQRSAPATQYMNGFASQPQARPGTRLQRSAPATQYMNGFASQPQSRSSQVWSAEERREYTTQRDDRGRSGASSQSEDKRYSQPPSQTSRSAPAPKASSSQQASRSAPVQASRSQPVSRSAAPPPQALRSQPASRSAAPPQASSSQPVSRSAPPPTASRSQPVSRSAPPPQASRSAPAPKSSAPAQSSKGDSGGSGERSSGRSSSSRGDSGKSNRS